MKSSVKIALATAALAAFGGLFLAGTSFAERGFGHHGMRMGMMGGLAHEMLANVDTNDDGALSQQEIDAAVNGRFAQFDANADSQLTLEEFQALWADITRPLAVRAFQLLDPNGDTAIARDEIDRRFGTLVQHFDRNDDGMLSHDDRPHGGRFWRGRGGGEEDQE